MLRSNSYRGDRMDYHHHARLTIYRREELAETVIQGRLSLQEAAAEFKLSLQSAAKWGHRFRAEKQPGLRDRSSRPQRSPRSTSPELMDRMQRLRRERWTGVRIAQSTGLSRATVSRILVRLKLHQIRMLEPAVPIVRYELPAAGDLLHIDIKKLARIHKPGHRITGNPQDETAAAPAGSFFISPSMTTPASPSPPCCRMKKRPLPAASSARPWPTSPTSASRSVAS